MSEASRPARTAADVKLERLPVATLVGMIGAYGRLYQKVDGYWYLAIMDRWGNEAALECDATVWDAVIAYEIRLLSEVMGMSGRTDLDSFIEIFRISPMTVNLNYSIDRDAAGDAVLTVTGCRILEAIEKEGRGREASICQMVDRVIFGSYARHFGPHMTIEPLKIPPRPKGEPVCCQWQLKTHQPAPARLPLGRLDFNTLPRATLKALVKAYCRLYQVVDGLWYLAAQARWGREAALACDRWVWERMARAEVDQVSSLLGLKGRDDLNAFIDVFLTLPMNMTTDYEVQWPEPNRAIVNFTFCPVLRALEKEGQGREQDICRDIDVLIFSNWAKAFSPGIRVTPLFLPPRRDGEKTACRWEFKK